LAQLKSVERIDVLHHEVPNRQIGTQGGSFQQFQEKHRGIFLLRGHFLTEFAHSEQFAIHRVFKSHRQYFIVIQRRIQRYITQKWMKGILCWLELSGKSNFIVGSITQTGKWRRSFEHIQYTVGETGIGIGRTHQLLKQVVGIIARKNNSPIALQGRIVGPAFTQIHEAHHIAHVGIHLVSVRNPYFNAGNYNVRPNHRQTTHGLVVIVAEMLRQEEVAVGVVLIYRNVEPGSLRTALNCYLLGLSTLLRQYRGYPQPAKLHLGL